MTKQYRDSGETDRDAPVPAPGRAHAVGTLGTTVPVPARLVVETLVAEVMAGDAGPVTVTIDMPHTLLLAADEATLRRILLPLVARSVDITRRERQPGNRRGEVLITAVEYPGAIEIELADSGPGLDDRDLVAFGPRASGRPTVGADAALVAAARMARAAGGTLTAVNCPDGGAALTFRLPTQAAAAMRRAA